jgi:acetyltransferase-like isoleucine patch superfamily enzyme
LIGSDVELLIGGNHRTEWVTNFALREVYGLPGAYLDNPWSKGDVTIDDGAMIGRGSRIMSGVRLGRGAVVMPYSIVTRDVPPGATVLGQPAREVHPSIAPSVYDASPKGSPMTHPVLHWRTLVKHIRRGVARRLRSAARLVDEDTLEPFPAISDAPVDPPPVVAGTGSYFLPVVRCEPGRKPLVTIGNYSSISYDTECLFSGVGIPNRALRGESAVSLRLTEDVLKPEEIRFGHDVWVTRGTRVLGGVRIGDGAVVAAYSVVTEDVRPYAIVAGNPAREIGRRFDDDTVAALLRISWWNWTEADVKSRWEELCSPDVGVFIRKYGLGFTTDGVIGQGPGI